MEFVKKLGEHPFLQNQPAPKVHSSDLAIGALSAWQFCFRYCGPGNFVLNIAGLAILFIAGLASWIVVAMGIWKAYKFIFMQIKPFQFDTDPRLAKLEIGKGRPS